MNDAQRSAEALFDAPPLDRNADLQTVLSAWHVATLRLERTHETLRGEVERLRGELEIKNRELARKNRLADLGRMASHVAHEVRNSLVPVALYMSLLRRRLATDAGSLDVLGKVESGIMALDTTVNDLLQFTAERDPQRESFAVQPLVEEILTSLSPQFAAQSIAARCDCDPAVTTVADRSMVRRALLNLVLNSIDAMREGGELLVRSVQDPSGIVIEVADRGEGLSDEAERRAFEPFFTTKSSGTGLGLAIVERIAELHGGEITMANRSGGGATVALRLPAYVKEACA